MPVRGVKSVELKQGGQSENWPVMEGALFIYPHKRAHLYICPYNFIVLSPQHKDGERYFSCSTCFKQKCACLLIKKAQFKHHCLHCFLFFCYLSLAPVCHLLAPFSLCGCTEDWRENSTSRSSACEARRSTRFSKVN